MKITLDVPVRLGTGNADILSEGKCAYSVNYAEIDRFGSASHQRSYGLNGHIEYLRCGYCVYIVAVVEGGYHRFIVCDVGENSQLDL